MEELILTMLEALDDYGEKELNFTKDDIDKLIKKYINFDNLRCNELGLMVLNENGYLSNDKLSKLLNYEYIDDEIYIIIDSFEEILNKTDYDFEIEILDHDYPDNLYNFDTYDTSIELYIWDDYNEETLKDIIKYCIDNGLEYEGEELTEENIKIVNGKILVNDVELKDIIREEDFDELYNILNTSACEAQSSADADEIVNKIHNNFEDDIGKIKYENTSENEEIIKINLNIDLSEIKNFLKDIYGEFEYEEESFGSLIHILKEMDYFDFSKPDYRNIYGDIDKSHLNEITQERLSWE